MSDKITLADLPMESKTGRWIALFNGKRREIEKEIFLAKLKAAALKLDSLRDRGEQDRSFKKAQRAFNFLFEQLDDESSDKFTMFMFATEDWEV